MNSDDRQPVFAMVGNYNGTMVAMRKMQLTHVELTKSTLVELNQVLFFFFTNKVSIFSFVSNEMFASLHSLSEYYYLKKTD